MLMCMKFHILFHLVQIRIGSLAGLLMQLVPCCILCCWQLQHVITSSTWKAHGEPMSSGEPPLRLLPSLRTGVVTQLVLQNSLDVLGPFSLPRYCCFSSNDCSHGS